VGLPWGSILALVLIIIYLVCRKVITFDDAMSCIPKGFTAMVPAITILTLATSLKNMTNALDASSFVQNAMANAAGLQFALPAIVFVVATVIAFATGTSWGTFGILIPIVSAVFPEESPLFFVGISACLAGAVCGDHCSPISDTTIMSSAGAHCNHIDHVSTQLPYAMSVAAISFVAFLLAGIFNFFGMAWLSIPIGVVCTVVFLIVMKNRQLKRK
jgi:Na+/H+ antiporter NhaC